MNKDKLILIQDLEELISSCPLNLSMEARKSPYSPDFIKLLDKVQELKKAIFG